MDNKTQRTWNVVSHAGSAQSRIAFDTQNHHIARIAHTLPCNHTLPFVCQVQLCCSTPPPVPRRGSAAHPPWWRGPAGRPQPARPQPAELPAVGGSLEAGPEDGALPAGRPTFCQPASGLTPTPQAVKRGPAGGGWASCPRSPSCSTTRWPTTSATASPVWAGPALTPGWETRAPRRQIGASSFWVFGGMHTPDNQSKQSNKIIQQFRTHQIFFGVPLAQAKIESKAEGPSRWGSSSHAKNFGGLCPKTDQEP